VVTIYIRAATYNGLIYFLWMLNISGVQEVARSPLRRSFELFDDPRPPFFGVFQSCEGKCIKEA
jgi:hypothetical protein